MFSKYHGAGNDFVCVDDREGAFQRYQDPSTIATLCARHTGIGADGLILLQTDASAADGLGLRMVYFNADGMPSSFCGNGSRCFLLFAFDLGLLGEPGQKTLPHTVNFEANDGTHVGEVLEEDWRHGRRFRVSMRVEGGVERLAESDDRVETGSPHFVRWCSVLPEGDITAEARAIRYSRQYKFRGINVNFVSEAEDGSLTIRTYERGVEAETLACGTGVTAAVLSFAERRQLTGAHRVCVKALGGTLDVAFVREADGALSSVTLEGPAKRVYSGEHAGLLLIGA